MADGMYAAGRAASDLRRHNRAVVLELVRARGPISQAEVARAGRLSTPTVVEIVNCLMEEGLVRTAGRGPSTGGRRPVLLELVPDAYCAVGVEAGTRTLTVVVTDLGADIKLRLEAPSRMGEGPEALMEQVHGALAEAFEQIPAGLGPVCGIGMALPSPVLSSDGTPVGLPGYSDWGQLQLGERMAEEYGVPVLIDNDANAAALGEHLFGAGRGVQDMFYVAANWGIGGAAIVNGELYRGAYGGAGEIGHTIIDIEGPRCACGDCGCLEAFAGTVAIARRASRALRLSGRQEMGGAEPDRVRTNDVIEAGLSGDETAAEVLRDTGRYLGMGISNVVRVLDPALVVLGGSIMEAGDLVLSHADEVVQRRALNGATGRVRVVAGKLREDAGAVGAAALALRETFVGAASPQGGED
jgi:N-acetylglucosamine repressor